MTQINVIVILVQENIYHLHFIDLRVSHSLLFFPTFIYSVSLNKEEVKEDLEDPEKE